MLDHFSLVHEVIEPSVATWLVRLARLRLTWLLTWPIGLGLIWLAGLMYVAVLVVLSSLAEQCLRAMVSHKNRSRDVVYTKNELPVVGSLMT